MRGSFGALPFHRTPIRPGLLGMTRLPGNTGISQGYRQPPLTMSAPFVRPAHVSTQGGNRVTWPGYVVSSQGSTHNIPAALGQSTHTPWSRSAEDAHIATAVQGVEAQQQALLNALRPPPGEFGSRTPWGLQTPLLGSGSHRDSDLHSPPSISSAAIMPETVEREQGDKDCYRYGELLQIVLPHLQETGLLYQPPPSVDPCNALAWGSTPSQKASLWIDQARYNELNQFFGKPQVLPKGSFGHSRFRLAPPCMTQGFKAPVVDPKLRLMYGKYAGMSRKALEHTFNSLAGTYEGVMASYRLAYHGTIMTRALAASLESPGSLAQVSVVRHLMGTQTETLQAAARTAASLLVVMRELVLHLAGLQDVPIAPAKLLASPFGGQFLFGASVDEFLADLKTHSDHMALLQGAKRSLTSAGAPKAKKARSKIPASSTVTRAQAPPSQPVQTSSRGGASKGSRGRQRNKPKGK
jgi:hypothetical protein